MNNLKRLQAAGAVCVYKEMNIDAAFASAARMLPSPLPPWPVHGGGDRGGWGRVPTACQLNAGRKSALKICRLLLSAQCSGVCPAQVVFHPSSRCSCSWQQTPRSRHHPGPGGAPPVPLQVQLPRSFSSPEPSAHPMVARR